MQIKELGTGKQYGIFGNTVNVPMNPAEVVTALPRRMNEKATIQLQFMRKTCYKRPYLYESIRPKVIYDITKHFVQTSELYKEEKVELNEDWLSDFNNSDEVDFITVNTDSSEDSNEQTLTSSTMANLQENQSTQQLSRNTTLYNLQDNTLTQANLQDNNLAGGNVQYNNPTEQNVSNFDQDDWEEIYEEDRISGNCDT